MDRNSNTTWLVVVILLGIFLQIVLVSADDSQAPHRVAIAFAQSFYRLDPAMADYLCSEGRTIDDVDVVEAYIYNVSQTTAAQGFKPNWARSRLYGIATETTFTGDDRAVVKLTADRRKEINPVFAVVAKIFFIGGTYPVEDAIQMVKEDGQWKVCGGLLPAPQEA